jgi:alkanesulfonate monooxygenase SsuD/methylene tetrahydromethanopterin reductase-like flavin-dependent oxidoreductase (luciferase family)
MKIGIGLPNTIPGTPGDLLVEWARRAESAGFSSLATIDRVAYPSFESLIALAAAGAATTRIGLFTNVLLGPTRNPVLLAKESASVHQLSAGRLTLGLAVGTREDDYEATGQDFRTRGRRWDEDLRTIHRAWRGEPVNGAQRAVGPSPVGGDRVPIMIGGQSDRAIARLLEWGVGWTAGGAPPDVVAQMAERVRGVWAGAGKPGRPAIAALTYFNLSEDAEASAVAYLTDYYGDWGPRIAQYAPKSPDQLRETAKRFEDAGVDELFVDPTLADLAEIDRAAEVLL